MKTKTMTLTAIETNEQARIKRLFGRVSYGAIYIALAAFLIMLVMFSGVAMGNSQISDTLFEGVSYGDDAETSVTIGDDDLYAEAASRSYGGNDKTIAQSNIQATNNYLGNGWTYRYNGNPGGNLYRYYYWQGNSSNNNYDVWNGGFGVRGGGTVRQKEIVMTAYVRVTLSGVLADLARAGKLYISRASATMKSTNGYDQNMRWWVANGSPGIGSDASSYNSGPSGGWFIGNRWVTSNNSAGTLAANGTYYITSTTFSICMSCQTNYTKKIGGRYPGAQIYNIDLTFNSADSTGPVISLNDVGEWAKTKSVSVNVTDSESGNSMYSQSCVMGTNTQITGAWDGTKSYTFSNLTDELNCTFVNRSGKKSNKIFSVDALKIDRNAPVIDNLELITANQKTGYGVAADTSYHDVYLRVTAKDAQSGIGSVSVLNETSMEAVAEVSNYDTDKNNAIRIFGPLPANGKYTITVNDVVGWPTTKNIDCWCIDKVNPVIEKVIFEYGDITTETLSDITTSSKYVNGPIKVTFIIKEKADETYYPAYDNNTYKNLHKLKEFSLTYNGKSVGSAEEYTEEYENGTWSYRYTYYMPHTGTYRYTIKDNSGKTLSEWPQCGQKIEPYIDTTAPKTTSYSLTPDATKTWTQEEVVLTIALSDSYSGGVMNQGSGLKRIWLFKNEIPSGIDFTTDAPKSHGNYVAHNDLSGNTTSTSFTLSKYDYCDVTTYCWVVVDNAGNTSQMSSANRTYNGTLYSNYYKNDGGSKEVTPVKRDMRDVKLKIYDSSGDYAYSTSSESEVRLAWTNATETTFRFIADFGPSGATIKVAIVSAANSTDEAINDARELLNSATFVPIATSDLSGANVETFKDALYNEGNKGKNEVTVNYTVKAPDTTLYKFSITNGAGVEYRTGIIIVQRDLKGPEVELLGFGTGYTHGEIRSIKDKDGNESLDYESIKKRIDNFISEEELYGYTSAWYGNPLSAVILIKDSGSGVLGAPQSYNAMEGVTATVASKAKAKVTFSHNEHTYTTETGYYQAGGERSVLVVPLWNLEDIVEKCPSIYNESTKTYDIKQGQGEPFVYNIRVADFCGNYSDVTNSGGSANLTYHVDPFELDLEVESIKQVDEQGNITDYDSTPTGNWTRNKVVVTVKKTKLGLSPVWVKYYEKTVEETSDGTLTNLITKMPAHNSSDWSSQLVKGDSGGGTKATIEFPATSRFVQLAIMVDNSTTNKVGGPLVAFMNDASDDYTKHLMIIRQDTDAPNMNGMGYFFSTNPDIKGNPYDSNGKLREDILLYYLTEYDKDNDTYKSTRQTANRGVKNVWSYAPAYLYIIASDATGSEGYGMGSGIDTIQFTAGTLTEFADSVYYDGNNYRSIYRSKTALGYTDIKENYELKIKLADRQGNIAQYTMSKDTDGQKLLPVVDTVIPMITIGSAASGTPAVSYLKDGKFIGNEENVLKTDLNVYFNLESGISGAAIYARRRPWQEDIDGSCKLVVNNSVRADNKYGFISVAGIKLDDAGEPDPSEWEKISVSYEISSSIPVKNRFDFLVVSGTGVYYYLEAGDVFIDTVPPVIEEDLIFYALESSEENLKGDSFDNPINYDNLRIATLSTMTNDNVYAYFRITDINGSGIDDDTVKALEPTAGEVLTKVYVYRAVNGTYVTEEYYRLKMTETNNYSIEASDVAGNRVVSKQYKPSIDQNPITLQVSMTDSDGKTYAFYDGAYTNAEHIKVTLSASYGLSGLGKVMFSTSDDSTTWTPYQDLSVLLTLVGSDAKWQTNDRGSQSAIEFNIYTEQNKYYWFVAYNGVTVYKTEDGRDVVPKSERGGKGDPIKVAIDKTAPVIDVNNSLIKEGDVETTGGFVTVDAGAKLYETEKWYGTGLIFAILASDPNDFGSGISKIRVDHELDGVSQDTYLFTERDGYYYAADGDKDFVYDNYAEYKITLTDCAGNENAYTIRPKIDTVKPEIVGGAKLIAFTDDGKAEYTADTWTKFDVDALFEAAYSISGASLWYARSDGNGKYGEWKEGSTSYSFGDFTVADNKKKKYSDSGYSFRLEKDKLSFDHTYKFRIISGAGLVSEEVTVGRIKIDKEKPDISVTVSTVWGELSKNNLEDLTNTNPYSTIMSGWTQDSVTIVVTTGSALVSGFKIVYNVNQGEEKWNEAQGSVGNGASTYQLDGKTFTHRITTSKYEENYQYYFESGSGMRSETYNVNGIKIDKAEPDIAIEAEKSDEYGDKGTDGNKFATTTADKYEQNKLASLDDSQIDEINRIQAKKYSYGTFTDRNSVIIKVTISSINYSGVTLSINGYVYETFDYADYKDKVSKDSPIERYYVVNNDYRDVTFTGSDGNVGSYYNSQRKMFDLSIVLYSGAGKKNSKAATVGIDNDIPFIYVAGVTGTKSTDWDPSNPDNCWYVSSDAAINLKVGTLRRDGENYRFSEQASDSGYTIYYAYDNGSSLDALTWINNNETSSLGIGQSIAENQRYRFKIVSNSGMEYIVGCPAYDNMGATAVTATDIKSIIEDRNGLVSHLADEDFVYRMNVDSVEYALDISRRLPFVSNGKNIVEERLEFADYTIVKTINVYDADGSVIGTKEVEMTDHDYIYNHGDRVTVKYVANVSDGYYHRYTDYGVSDGGVLVEESKSVYENADVSNETSGSFDYKFGYGNLKINAYFVKELKVIYGGTIIYRQSQDEAAVSATTTYTYKIKDSAGKDVSITVPVVLNVGYADMSGNEVSAENMEVGGYLVNTVVDGENAYSFRLVNPQTVLLVKYFDETVKDGEVVPNSVENPYSVYDNRDLEYVTATYYKDFAGSTGSFVLGTKYSYSDNAFSLKNDIETGAEFGGIERFNGSFDGNNNVISLYGGAINGSYGLFGTLGGTVKNLIINVNNELVVTDGTDVGVLASTIDNGIVSNVRVSADMQLGSLRSDANVGGLAGKVTGTSVIGSKDKKVFVDVTVVNKGNKLTGGNIGGLIGYLGGDSKVSYTYTYSQITVYNVSAALNVGAVIGDAEKKNFDSGKVGNTYENNVYLNNNVFVNDRVKAGFMGASSNAEDEAEAIKAAGHDAFVGNTASNVGWYEVAGESIRNLVLKKLYNDFGAEIGASGAFENGLGTEASPFIVTTKKQLRVIDNYVNLYYELSENVDMTGFGESIGLHKVFGGKFDGKGHRLDYFDGTDMSDGDVLGLFAAVSGTVTDIIMPTVEISAETGSGTVYGGVIAGRLLGGVISKVIIIGTFDVTGDDVYAGGVAGISEGGEIYDIFSIVNVKVIADEKASAGGIVGSSDNTKMGGKIEYTQAIYALGRVEVESVSATIGAVVATGTLAEGSSDVYAIKDNAYSNGQITNASVSGAINMVAFDDDGMRSTTFSDGTNAFNKVFSDDGNLYYLKGLGRSNSKFKVTTAEEFRKIEHMLYAHYNIANDIEFNDKDPDTAFRTIGYGLKFTGSIDGKNQSSWSAEEGTLSSLMNVTDSLVYNNAGSITDLGINVYYSRTVVSGETVTFGSIAAINSSGTLRNVTVSGEIDIVGEDKYDTTVIVSGFVGQGLGGVFESDSKVQNSISGLAITVKNVGTVYAGGYVGKVDGLMTLSYGIGNGTLNVSDCGTVYAGTIVGAAYRKNEWSSLEETKEYRYIVTVDDEVIESLFGIKVYEE